MVSRMNLAYRSASLRFEHEFSVSVIGREKQLLQPAGFADRMGTIGTYYGTAVRAARIARRPA